MGVTEMNDLITLELPRSVLDSARLTPDELKVELAVLLYQQARLSVGKARELAGMSLWQFRQLLASRQIGPHYGIEEYQEDLDALREVGLL
jgi:predicted HTH domain antitoxin